MKNAHRPRTLRRSSSSCPTLFGLLLMLALAVFLFPEQVERDVGKSSHISGGMLRTASAVVFVECDVENPVPFRQQHIRHEQQESV